MASNPRSALVIGGTAGIGRALARRLVDEGAAVTIVGRPTGAGAAAAAAVGAEFLPADVSELAEVRRLADVVASRSDAIHTLVQAADVIKKRRVDTADGFEVGFATNYLSRFLLVGLLLPQLLSGRAEILHVAAAGAPGRLALRDVPPPPSMGAFRAHGLGQGANDVYGLELADRLAGTGVRVHVANPGAADTGIRDEINTTALGKVLSGVFGRVMTMRTPEQVAEILLTTARAYPDDVLIGIKGRPVRIPARARDSTLRDGLWRRSEALTQLTVPLPRRAA